MRKILKVEEPPEKRRTCWSLWVIHFEGLDIPTYMNEYNYKLLLKKIELSKKGISDKDLDEFEDLVRAVVDADNNNESY